MSNFLLIRSRDSSFFMGPSSFKVELLLFRTSVKHMMTSTQSYLVLCCAMVIEPGTIESSINHGLFL